MEEIRTIGLDLAKSVFQVHGISAAGGVVVRRKLRRSALLEFFAALPPALVGMEACDGAHHWARELTRLGHTVRLMPPAYVKPYVKRGKTDAADAEAICEAVTRPTMRFVPVKTEAQQASLMELKVRDMLVRQRTQTINALRSHLAEYGIVAAQGRKFAELIAVVRDGDDTRLPEMAREALGDLVAQIEALEGRIERLDSRMVRHAREDEAVRRLASIPGIGAISATALAAMLPNPHGFASGRHFAASLGLTPKPHSSGGKERLGRISRQGNSVLRRLLVPGATSRLRNARRNPEAADWATRLLARRPFKVVAVALANKMARITWALLARGGTYTTTATA
ncbi:IS110 family transposase [Belnapia sp. F-4-1]|uniref:IS110 family transposase n=1 Tax=Belnapia sp. F-4-1 TaxID=1545443 RepID=UPI0005BB0191|nr:IS110 family transposase [Belnapia sp. F-4-1]